MRRIALAFGLLASLAAAAPGETERNRRIIADFAHILYAEKDVERAFTRYVAEDYIQHNPGLADGRAAAIAALKPIFSTPGARFDVKRILVDGDMAVIHLHGRGDPNGPGGAVADFYRLKGGRIVEHWDVIQKMPETSANAHPMF